MYYIHIPNSVRKSIRKIPLPWQVRVLGALRQLRHDPYLGDKMSGDKKDKRKIRVWPYRILYRLHEADKYIDIVEVGHRGHMSYD